MPSQDPSQLNYFVERGKRSYEKGISFAKWSERMIVVHGNTVVPYLREAWQHIKLGTSPILIETFPKTSSGNNGKNSNGESKKSSAYDWKLTAIKYVGAHRAIFFAFLIAILVGGYWWTHRNHTGYVANARYAATSHGHPTFLDLGRPFPFQEMTIVIWGTDRPAFPQPPEIYYLHRTIRVYGKITKYQGHPEIVVTSPSQIKIQE